MKKFSEFSKRPVKRLFEADEMPAANLPQNYGGEQQGQAQSQGQVQVQAQSQGQVQGQAQQEPEQQQDGDGNVSQFFSKLFESREMAHIYHLQVNGEMGSHAAHTALGDYYEGVLDFIDNIIETYQGQYGVVEEYDVIDTKSTKSKEVVEYFEELAKYIKDSRRCISSEDTHLHNIIDEVVALIYRTLYKLKFTK